MVWKGASLFTRSTGGGSSNANSRKRRPPTRKSGAASGASTEDLVLDNQNRITLSPELLGYAHIRSQAVLNGVIDRLELWSPEAWQAYLDEEGTPSLEQTVQRFGDFIQKANRIVRREREGLPDAGETQ
jgi:hypothetical protein